MSYSLSRMDEKGDVTRQESLIKATAATMHSAGADSVKTVFVLPSIFYLIRRSQIFAAVASCIIALLNHPDILKRALEQIDSIIPFGDLPTFDEEDKLPLVTAICMEAIRWRVIVPAGMSVYCFMAILKVISLSVQAYRICCPKMTPTRDTTYLRARL